MTPPDRTAPHGGNAIASGLIAPEHEGGGAIRLDHTTPRGGDCTASASRPAGPGPEGGGAIRLDPTAAAAATASLPPAARPARTLKEAAQ